MQFWYNGHAIERLGRRYRLDGHLGSGGMAEVCLAWDERVMRRVAVKILKADDLDQESLNRFMKEAGQIVHWRHPHILRVYDTMQIELLDPARGSLLFYFIMEYAAGGDLHKRLTPGSPFPLSASFALFRQLCDAVRYAHKHGVVHRDLKPLNILFRRPATGPEEVVLSDFGLAVQVDASHYTFARGGTLAYMAPEQFAGEISPACDIFALGVILYQLCTGRLPFRRLLQDLPRVQDAPPPTRPSRLNPDLPPELDAPILRALHTHPAQRYPSAGAFWQAIEQVLTGIAQTYPYLSRESWLQTGQTWPFASANQPPARPQASQSCTGATAGPVLSDEARTEEPGEAAIEADRLWEEEAGDEQMQDEAAVSVEDDRAWGEPSAPSRVPRRASALSSRYESRAAVPTPGVAFQSPGTRRTTYAPGTDPHPARPRTETSRARPRSGVFPGSPDRRRPAAPLRVMGDGGGQPISGEAARSGSSPNNKSGQRPIGPRSIGRRVPRPVALLALVLLLAALLLATTLPGSPFRVFGVSPTVVTITPLSRLEQNTYQFTAVPTNPDPALRQVQARLLSTTTPAQSTTVNATGSTPATRATGQLTFINNTANAIILQSTILTGKSGIQVSFQGPVTIPANPPTTNIPGFAVNPGAAGNIPTLDISEPCCVPNDQIFVKNTAFTGGHDAGSVVQQSDIDNAARGLSGTLTQSGQIDLQGQVMSNERVVDGSLKCQPNVSANHRAGEVAKTVTISVSMTCSEEVYDYQAVANAAGNLLRAQAGSDPKLGRAYSLSGPLTIDVLSVTAESAQGQAAIQVRARGLWAYSFSPDLLRHLAAQLAGKTKAQALDLLLHQPGIASARFNSDNTLPADSNQIQVVVQPPAAGPS